MGADNSTATSAMPTVTAFRIGGVRVSIEEGKLAKCQADVIVDSTTASLKLGTGGLSASLLNEAGSQLQADCDKNYPNGVKQGNIAVTNGYKLRCCQVYHGSLPIWDESYSSRNIMCEFVCNCLKQASKDKHTSIAFPTLGTGKLNFPAEIAAKTMLQCIMKHASHTSLTDITIVVFNGGDKWYQIKTVFEQEMAICRDRNTPARPKVTAYSIGDVRVSIEAGKLAKCQADVIVDNTAASLKLDNGGLSESLLLEAGSQLQEDCNKNFPNGVKQGNIAVTDGYNLRCYHVYHGSLPNWDNSDKSKNILCEFVCNCLKQANNNKATSIAFPTLGMGKLNFPADVAAKTMFECIMKHASDTSLTDITIVVYNGGDKWYQIKTVFEQELAKCRNKNTPG